MRPPRRGDLALYGRIARQGRSAWPRIALLFLVALLASPIALLEPLPLKLAVDSVLGSRPLPGPLDAVTPDAVAGSPTSLLVFIAALALLITVASQLQSLAQQVLMTTTGERLVREFRARIFRHLQKLPLAYHDTTSPADSVYRIQNDAPAIRNIMIDGFVPLVGAAVTLAGMVYVMLRLDWQLALIALAVAPPLMLAIRRHRPRLRRQSRAVKQLESSALTMVNEVLGSLRVVKVFDQEEREADRFAQRIDEGVRGRIALVLAQGRFNVLIGILFGAGAALVLLVGTLHVRNGTLSLGNLLLLMGYVGQLYKPLKTISSKTAVLQGYLASAERAFSVLDETLDLPERPDAVPVVRARGAVALESVSFSYDPDRPALHGVSFGLAPETRLGIVGPTGSGKSTLVSLLIRLYDPTGGRVLLDGVDLRDYRLEDLRRQFALVPQDPTLFSASIGENIAYADPRATHEQIVAAARAAGIHDFITDLPHGYDTQIGERGVMLSGGQRQRIAIARAFLKDSPVLILDEPTSAVDQGTETAIVEAIERLQRGRTVIVISHRPSAVEHCTAFLTLEQGRVLAHTRRTPRAEPVRAITPASRLSTSSAKRREALEHHPAVEAWRRLDPERRTPDRITPAKSKVGRARTTLSVYRLGGVGENGTAVIAKRSTLRGGRLEGTVYRHLLPSVSLPGPRFYGTVEDPDQDLCWLFIGEIGGTKYDPRRPDHRTAAARWLGVLHTRTRRTALDVELPDAGPERYRVGIARTRTVIEEASDNPALDASDLASLEGLLARLDQLEDRWDRLERACAGAPETLLHGDFATKNLRVESSPEGPRILAYDWEDAGRGVPAVDLAQVSTDSVRFCAAPDLAVYAQAVREHWPGLDRENLERLAACGTVFRGLAAIGWESDHLAHPWANGFVPTLQAYDAHISAALHRLGWSAPPEPVSLRNGVGSA